LSQSSELKIDLEETKVKKLRIILEDLYKEGAIESLEFEEFMRFTLFIVFDEYDKNVSSLRAFYKANLQKYLDSKGREI